MDFTIQFETQFVKIIRIKTDNGTEFLNNELNAFLKKKGIVHLVAFLMSIKWLGWLKG